MIKGRRRPRALYNFSISISERAIRSAYLVYIITITEFEKPLKHEQEWSTPTKCFGFGINYLKTNTLLKQA